MVVNTVNDYPQLLRCDLATKNNWLKVRTIGTQSNRSGIGARVRCVTRSLSGEDLHQQVQEVRSGGSYLSQSDLRLHFGLGAAESVERLEIQWPSGHLDTLRNLAVNRLIHVKEGEGILRTEPFERRTTGKT